MQHALAIHRPALDAFRALLPADFQVPCTPVAVGWSGGADSTALLLALLAAGCDVRAWHVDHAWREASEAEAGKLADQALRWQVPFHRARLDPMASTNREAEARQARYAQFLKWSLEQGVGDLYLGHHREDQAETVCMRLLQGAGVAGCCGMQVVRTVNGLRIIRPLLATSRESIRQALMHTGVGWIEDSSNLDTTLWRNRIRHRLFPAMRQTGHDPVALFMRWQRQAERVAIELSRELEDIQLAVGDEDVSMAWHDWHKAPIPVRAGLLQQMVRLLLGSGATPGRRHILLVEKWTQDGGRGGLDLSRCRLERHNARLHLRPMAAMLR